MGYNGFSARTSLELLRSDKLSNEQLGYEIKYLQLLDPSANLRTRFPSFEVKQGHLDRVLSKGVCSEVDNIVSNYDDFILSLSYSLKAAQKHIDELQSHTFEAEDTTVPAGDILNTTPENYEPGKLDPPVSVLDINFNGISTEEVLSTFDFTDKQSCGRQTVYFGKHPYAYGRVKHDPQPYPDTPIFNHMFSELHKLDNTFNKENFSCLVTLYKDGSAHIPSHQDNESCIQAGSIIYTISMGATRTLKCQNINDFSNKLEEYLLELKHGMVYTMTHESQHVWHHGIDRESQVMTPRVSFTFRHTTPLNEGDNTPRNQDPPPPITRPDTVETHTMKRVLLRTDSIHQNTPAHLFNNIPNHAYSKKLNYRLTGVFEHSPAFKHSDYVILSCGINDLSRYGFTADTLADQFFSRLVECCKLNPRTKFIFNSLLMSRQYEWLNYEADKFNVYMSQLAKSVPNLYFFNSHGLLKASSSNVGRGWEPQGNGLHISLDARKLIIRELINCIGKLSGASASRFKSSRWLIMGTRAPYRCFS